MTVVPFQYSRPATIIEVNGSSTDFTLHGAILSHQYSISGQVNQVVIEFDRTRVGVVLLAANLGYTRNSNFSSFSIGERYVSTL